MFHEGDEPDAFCEMIVTSNKMLASNSENVETNVMNITELLGYLCKSIGTRDRQVNIPRRTSNKGKQQLNVLMLCAFSGSVSRGI